MPAGTHADDLRPQINVLSVGLIKGQDVLLDAASGTVSEQSSGAHAAASNRYSWLEMGGRQFVFVVVFFVVLDPFLS